MGSSARGAAPASPLGPSHREGSADVGASARGGTARGAAPASPWGPGHREGSADEGASAKGGTATGAAPASPWGPGHREGSADEGASAKGGAGGVLADVLAALALAAMRHSTSTTMVAAAATRDRRN